jgi:hypothetical protein
VTKQSYIHQDVDSIYKPDGNIALLGVGGAIIGFERAGATLQQTISCHFHTLPTTGSMTLVLPEGTGGGTDGETVKGRGGTRAGGPRGAICVDVE